MIRKRNDLNGKVYGRRNRQMLMPNENCCQPQNKHDALALAGINRRGFRRSPHLQAVMDRIEGRRQLDRQKEIECQAVSRGRRNRQEDNYEESRWEWEDSEIDQGNILKVFAKYDNMLEHLVLKNLELVSLVEKKNMEIPDHETLLTEKVLKDLRALRLFREQQLKGEPLRHSLPELKDECGVPAPRMTRNPYLQFRRSNELLDEKEIGRRPTRCALTSTRPTSSPCTRNQPIIVREELVDTFRPSRQLVATALSIPESFGKLQNHQTRDEILQELLECQQKRHGTYIRKPEGAVQTTVMGRNRENWPRKDESKTQQFQYGKSKQKQLLRPRQQMKPIKSQSKESREGKLSSSDVRGSQHILEHGKTMQNELDEMWCMCPLDLPGESHPGPARISRELIEEEMNSYIIDSDNDSYEPTREAKKLKKRLSTIYQQSKSLKSDPEEMRGAMLQLQQGYKQKYYKLKKNFLENTKHPNEPQHETRESENSPSLSELNGPDKLYKGAAGARDDIVNYEVRDGVIVLDHIEDNPDNPDYEFLGVYKPQYIPNFSGGNRSMSRPTTDAPDDMNTYMDQDFIKGPEMDFPNSSEVHDQYFDVEWVHDPHGGGGVSQSLSHNHRIGRDENDTDDDDSLSDDTQSDYRTRREPLWNCGTEL